MKATGIVRRIDDLGRVVVPKEIRRTLRIREGDPLEIYTDTDGTVILKKYSPIGELSSFAKEYAESLAHIAGHLVAITDRDQIIATAGGLKKDYIGKAVSPHLEELMSERGTLNTSKDNRNPLPLTSEDEMDASVSQVIYPIICEGDVIGCVVIMGKDTKNQMSDTENKLAGVAATFLGRQMEG